MDRPHTQRDVNPLRPYYVPPSIGSAQPGNVTATAGATAPPPTSGPGLSRPGVEFLSDLSYGDYVTDAAPSVTELLKTLIDQAAWRYTSVLLGHPFEVAKLVLQVCDSEVYEGNEAGATGISSSRVVEMRSDDSDGVYADKMSTATDSDSDSDPDAPSYFTSSTPSPTIRRVPTRRTRPAARSTRSDAAKKKSSHVLSLPSPALTTVISQLWQTSGAWGVWAGANTSFVYKFVLKSLEMFIRGLLVALFDIQDAAAATAAVVDGPSTPWSGVAVAVAASTISALLTAPLDIARIRLMLTPPNHPPRTLLSSLSALPSPLPPLSLYLPTILHASLPTLLSSSTPHLLRSTLLISPSNSPSAYPILKAASSVLELGIRLPLETCLRRGQLALGFGEKGPGETIVPVGKYRGVGGTMWWIVKEEGSRKEGAGRRKGQGVEGLVRGWRVGIWGLVGVWGAGLIGGTGSVQGGEF